MKKNLKDYSSFKLTLNDILEEARRRCITEMYAKAQPSANYEDILKYYEDCKKKHVTPERIYQRHYLSFEEFKYILNKYLEAYNFKNQFKDDCDIIIRDLKEGCHNDLYIPEMMEDDGNFHSPYRGYENVPPISKLIGHKDARRVINFVKQRKEYYRFHNPEDDFSMLVSMGDSPTGNAQEVIDYWKAQGVDIKIDPRHYTNDDFWSEENGCYDDDEEEN